MISKSFHEIFASKGSIVYDLTNKIMILAVYNYYVFFLFTEIFIYKIGNRSFCYNFTYSQLPWF